MLIFWLEISILQRIKKIYNFDGPGFRKQEYESNKYQALTKKLVNIMPSGSLVGVLLYNDNYNISFFIHFIFLHIFNLIIV